MKKHLLISILFFAGGLACGYMIHLAMIGSTTQTNSTDPSGKSVVNAEQPAPKQGPPSPELVLDHILPNSSVFWVLADFKQMRDHKDSFQEIWKEEAVKSIGNEFLSSLPSGATQTFQVLSGASEAMRLFILPPPREGKPMFWIAVFIGNNDALTSLLSDIPNAEKETKTFGPNQIDVIKTPMGEIAVKQDDELLWLSMAPEDLAGILNTPAPPELAEKPAIHEDALRRFPHVGVALFTHSAHTIPPGPGVPGMLPQMLSLLGSDAAYAVLHWPNGEGRLTAIAHSEVASLWTASWAPLKSFPFSDDDPTGMLEIAFRRPAMAALADASEIAEGKVAPPVPKPMNGPVQHPPMNRDAKMREREERPNRLMRAGILDFYSMAKPDHIFSLNLFGFYKGSPAMAFAFPDFDPEGTLIDKFHETPGVKPEDVEIANLPGTRFQFKEGKRRLALPLSELIAIERDATMYLFDSDIAAQNYLGGENSDPDGKERRSDEIRKLLSQVRSPAQAQAVISRDWFEFLLRSEMARFQQPGPASEQFEALIQALSPHLKSAAVSAGFDGNEWFFDAYIDNEASMMIGSVLTAIHSYRWLNEN